MWRYLAGAVAALLLAGAGVLIFGAHGAKTPAALPAAPLLSSDGGQGDQALPDTVPAASDKTREQRRMDRYDKDRDGKVTRDEWLANRRKAFAKLDLNHDGQLSFDEWSAKAIGRFATADHDRSGSLDAREFATTAVKRKPKRQLRCPDNAAPATPARDDGDGG